MMEDYDRTMELVKVAQDSAGKSSEQFAKYQDTIEYKINQVKNSWEELRVSFLNSDLFNTLLNYANKILDFFKKMDASQFLSLGVIGLTIGRVVIQNFIKSIRDGGKSITKAFDDTITKSLQEAEQRRIQRQQQQQSTQQALSMMSDERGNLGDRYQDNQRDIQAERQHISELETLQENIGREYSANEQRIQAINRQLQRSNLLSIQHREELEEERTRLMNANDALQTRLNRQRESLATETQNLQTLEDENEQLERQARTVIENNPNIANRQSDNTASSENIESQVAATEAFKNIAEAGITTFVTTLIASEDVGSALQVAFGGIITTAIPYILEAILTKLASTAVVQSIVAFIAANAVPFIVGTIVVAGIAAAIAYYVKTSDPLYQAKQAAESAKETLEQAEKNAEEINKNATESQENLTNLQDIKEQYEKLSKIQYKTTEQQEEYNELITILQEQHPELIESYNEETNQLKLQTDELDKQIEKAKELNKEKQEEALTANLATISADYNSIIKDEKAKRIELQQEYDDTYSKKNQEYAEITNQLLAIESGEAVTGELSEDAKDEVQKLKERQQELEKELKEESDNLEKELQDSTEREKAALEEKEEQTKNAYKDYAKAVYGVSDEVADALANTASEFTISNEKLSEYQVELGGEAVDDVRKYLEEHQGKMANNFDKWEDLDSNLQKWILAGSGQTKESVEKWYNKRRTKGAKQEEIISALEAGYTSEENQKKLKTIMENSTEQQLQSYTDTIQSLNQKTVEELSNIDTSIFGEALSSEAEKSINEAKEKIKNILDSSEGVNIADIFGIRDSEKQSFIDSFSLDTANVLNDAIQSVIDATGSEQKAIDYTDTWGALLSGLKIKPTEYARVINEILPTITSITPSNLNQSKKQIAKQMTEIGNNLGYVFSESEIDGFIEGAIKASTDNSLISAGLTSALSINEYIDDLQKKSDFFSDKKSVFEQFLNTDESTLRLKESGAKTVKELESTFKEIESELGITLGDITDYYTIDGDTVIFNAEKIRDIYKEQTEEKVKNLQATRELGREENKQQLASLQYEKAWLENKRTSSYYGGSEIFTEEDATRLTDINEQIEGVKQQEKEAEDEFKKQKKVLEEQDKLAKIDNKNWEDKNEELKEALKTLSSISSTYASLTKEQAEKGFLSANSISSFEEGLTKLNETLDGKIDFKQLDASDFLFRTSDSVLFAKDQFKEYLNTLIDAVQTNERFQDEDLLNYLTAVRSELNATEKELSETETKIQTAQKAYDDAQKDYLDAQKATADALKAISEAQQQVIDAQNELNETLYGTENYRMSDPFYNYTTNLGRLTNAVEEAKEVLENPSSEANLEQVSRNYLEAVKNEKASILAQNEVYAAAIKNYDNVLSSRFSEEIQKLNQKYGSSMDVNVSDFYRKVGDRWNINMSALSRANFSDEFKNEISEYIKQMNEFSDSIDNNIKSIKQREQELKEMRKTFLQAEVDMQDKVVDILKEKYEEEVDNLKTKYDQMKEADDDYLDALQDAISKQKKLREQEDKYSDLATKQKQLSLKQRDTSGANATDVQKLQQEIQKDQQSLLNESIDNVIEQLQEFYELQSESREEEIEYQETLLENSNLIAEANAIILGWNTADDAIQWMLDNNEEVKDMSTQAIELLKMEWEDAFNQNQTALDFLNKNIEESVEVTAEEINNIILDTSETLTDSAEQSLAEIVSTVDKSIASAKESLQSALDSLAEKQAAYLTALDTEAEKAQILQSAYEALAQAQYEAGMAQKAYEDYLREAETQKQNEEMQNWVNEENAKSLLMSSINFSDELNLTEFQKNHDKYTEDEIVDILEEKGKHGVIYENNEDGTKFIAFKKSETEAAGSMSQYSNKDFTARKAFASGGLVNYTGPAWVDGTPAKPEAFLSAEDTKRIGNAASILASLDDLLNFNLANQNEVTQNISNLNNTNDTIINVVVNVDEIGNDYDVDQAIERVKQDILDATNYAGANVILRQ